MVTGAGSVYAGVVVEAPLTKIFHYRVPDHLAGRVAPGDRVDVPFARRTLRGVVVSLSPVPPIAPKLIKNLVTVSPEEERIPGELLGLTKWAAEYYRAGWGMVLAAAIPAGVKRGSRERGERRLALALPEEEALARAEDLRRRAPRQAGVLEAVTRWIVERRGENPSAAEADLRGALNTAAIKRLVDRGLLRLVAAEGARGGEETVSGAGKGLVLSGEQNRAVARVSEELIRGEYKSFLLHGVTGSGKTEVYMRLIARALEQGKGALALVPEISLTPQTAARFRARFGDVAVLHSHLGDGERAERWRRLQSGAIRLAVGARSAVFAPVARLGLVIVDEEHERSYKQDNDPRYHARDLALVRASRCGAVAVLGSATPSLESWNNVVAGKHELIEMPDRVGGARRPEVEVVDLRREWVDVKQPTLISRALERALGECLRRREQAILLLNRRGFHTAVRCAGCGGAVECGHCDVAMTHHRREGVLRCGFCGGTRGVPDVCPTCGSRALRFVGTGTERAEDTLRRIFPGARVLRMDSDSMTARDAHAAALASFANGDYDFLLGTQMVAKGLDFPNVTVVGVLMADGALGMSDFRAPERTFQLVTQVIGRAGRADKPGFAVVQAFQPEHPAVRCAVAQDYAAFVEFELPDRRRGGYPPCGRLARILLSGGDPRKVDSAAGRVGAALRGCVPGTARLLGPALCEIERAKGAFRRHLLLFAPESRTLADWIAASGVKPGEEAGTRTAIDIDPASMH